MTVGSEVAGDNEERRKRRKWLPGDLKSGLAISLLPLLLTASVVLIKLQSDSVSASDTLSSLWSHQP